LLVIIVSINLTKLTVFKTQLRTNRLSFNFAFAVLDTATSIKLDT